jgi:tryptophan synthase alpha chain
MERISEKFKLLQENGITAFIPFSVAGFPDPEKSLEIFLKLAEGDVLEFGFPFSDPVADGPVIQAASTEAIRNGITMDKALDMIREIRRRSDVPIIFFSYFNPIHSYGPERFVSRAKACGVDGVLVVDLPLNEARWLKPLTDKANLAWIYLATPTTPDFRIQKMDQDGSGFLYYVSVTGVTGTRGSLPSGLSQKCEHVRQICRLPVAVGFGISSPQQASLLRPHVDGVVVGSEIISRVQRGDSVADIGEWVKEMKAALSQSGSGSV